MARYGKSENSTPTRARSSLAKPSPAVAGNGVAIGMDGKGAWRDNVFVGGCGAASNTRRCICAPTTASAKLVLPSAGILTSTMAACPTRALTATHPIKPTPTRCPSAWQPNPRQRLHLAMRKICSENRDHYRPRAQFVTKRSRGWCASVRAASRYASTSAKAQCRAAKSENTYCHYRRRNRKS